MAVSHLPIPADPATQRQLEYEADRWWAELPLAHKLTAHRLTHDEQRAETDMVTACRQARDALVAAIESAPSEAVRSQCVDAFDSLEAVVTDGR